MNLKEILHGKERTIILHRFEIDENKFQTLEELGDFFSFTRERTRQLETQGLKKIFRVMGEQIKVSILIQMNFVIKKDELINIISKQLNIQKSWAKLYIYACWKNGLIAKVNLRQRDYHFAFKRIDILEKWITESIQEELEKIETSKEFISITKDNSIIKLSKKIHIKDNIIYLNECKKNIKNKAYIVLKKIGKPLHFAEISNKIVEAGFDKKIVTVQAVHNELIKDKRFILVGRGLYALREWKQYSGLPVADLLVEILKGKEMKMTDIELEVLKRKIIKKGTISVNLQKDTRFYRTGRSIWTTK